MIRIQQIILAAIICISTQSLSFGANTVPVTPPVIEKKPEVIEKFEKSQSQEPVVLPQPSKPLKVQSSKEFDIQDLVISKKNAKLGRKANKAVRLAQEWRNRKVDPTLEEKDGSVSYAFGTTQPSLVCKPLRVCVIKLEPGEKIMEKPHWGDTGRWEVTPSAGNGPEGAPHIFVKPFDSGLTTNLAIMTDRRTYIILLQSRNDDNYTPMISFRYPEKEAELWATHLAKQEAQERQQRINNQIESNGMVFDAESLSFDYAIKGDAAWKPTRVFNDGTKTYIQMPSKMKVSEAPVLLTINDGEEAIVNYRLRKDFFIVDQLFENAILIAGVGQHQTKVTIAHEKN